MATFIVLFLMNIMIMQTPGEIYEGKHRGQYVYYDDTRDAIIVEFGYKYLGRYDTLDKTSGQNDIIAKSKGGKLYRKKGELFNCNEEYKIDTPLRKVSYSEDIDYRRLNIFSVNAEQEVKALKSSGKISDFTFNTAFADQVKTDYKVFKESKVLPEGYVPGYITMFLQRK